MRVNVHNSMEKCAKLVSSTEGSVFDRRYVYVSRGRDEERNTVNKHDIRGKGELFLIVQNLLRYLNNVHVDMLRCPTSCLPSNVGKVRAINFVSIKDVSSSNRAVFDEIHVYQTLEFLLGRGTNHTHEAASRCCCLNLFFCKALILLTNGVHGKGGIGKVSIIDKNKGSIGVLMWG